MQRLVYRTAKYQYQYVKPNIYSKVLVLISKRWYQCNTNG